MKYSSILNKLMNKIELSETEAGALMKSIINKELSDAQIGGALIALQNKNVTDGELYAFIKTLKRLTVKIKLTNIYAPVIDTCGTGGDNSGTFNVSTICAFVLAGCGVIVAKHGNRAVSSACGSADVLEKLGVNINIASTRIKKCIEEVGIGFLFAQNHHPAFRNIAHIRKELGIKTVFNILGPLLNPANANCQLIGVYNPKLTELFARTLRKKGVNRAMVVHGKGLDEITICGKTKITELSKGKIRSYYITPQKAGLKAYPKKYIEIKKINPKNICFLNNKQILENKFTLDNKSNLNNKQILKRKSDIIQINAKIFYEILKGKKGAKRNLVLINAAAGLIVTGKAINFKQGVEIALESIDSGRALKKFQEFRRFTNAHPEIN